jgi:hypothetical protein
MYSGSKVSIVCGSFERLTSIGAKIVCSAGRSSAPSSRCAALAHDIGFPMTGRCAWTGCKFLILHEDAHLTPTCDLRPTGFASEHIMAQLETGAVFHCQAAGLHLPDWWVDPLPPRSTLGPCKGPRIHNGQSRWLHVNVIPPLGRTSYGTSAMATSGQEPPTLCASTWTGSNMATKDEIRPLSAW